MDIIISYKNKLNPPFNRIMIFLGDQASDNAAEALSMFQDAAGY